MGAAKSGKTLASWALLALSVLAIAYARSKAAASARAVKVTSDVFALPSPPALVEMSLGYRAALADLLYTSTIIAYGTHLEERRSFDFVGQYLDSIAALDPEFCQPYHYADLFLVYRASGNPPPEDIRHARRLIEQGMEKCPSDGALWLSAGQFMMSIAPQFLPDKNEVEEFRLAGATALAHAAALVHDGQGAQWQTLVAAGVFDRRGDRAAAVSFLERVYSVTDDPEIKANIEKRLAALQQEEGVDLAKRHREAFNLARSKDLAFVSRDELLVVGPAYNVARCSGGAGLDGECAGSWRAFFAAHLGR